jgi:hypothetical protein
MIVSSTFCKLLPSDHLHLMHAGGYDLVSCDGMKLGESSTFRKNMSVAQLAACFFWFVALVTFRPQKLRRYFPPKRRTFSDLQPRGQYLHSDRCQDINSNSIRFHLLVTNTHTSKATVRPYIPYIYTFNIPMYFLQNIEVYPSFIAFPVCIATYRVCAKQTTGL